MAKATLAALAETSDVTKYLREETVLIHTMTLIGNSCDARVLVTFDLPDGRVMTANKIVRLRFTESKD